MKPKITIKTLLNNDIIVITQHGGARLFIGAPDSLVIDKQSYIFILKQLLKLGYLDKRVLEGLLEEYNTL